MQMEISPFKNHLLSSCGRIVQRVVVRDFIHYLFPPSAYTAWMGEVMRMILILSIFRR